MVALGSGSAQSAAGRWDPVSVRGPVRQLVYNATATLLGQPVPVKVVFLYDATQTKTETGVLGFELWLGRLDGLSRFHFDDFEGPDAPALKRTPLVATVTAADGRAERFTFSPSGWYPTAGSFAFGVTAPTRVAAGPQRRLLTALAGAATLRIVVTDLRDAALTLDLTVPVAAQQADFRALLAGSR